MTRRILAALGMACLCASLLSLAPAQAAAIKKNGETQTLFPRKTTEAKSFKRGKTTVIDREGIVGTSKLPGFTSTTGYPKADKPVVEKPLAGKATGYSGLISNYAKAYGVPIELAHAVVRVESNFNPKARGRAGEIGLMQIKPATARMMGYRGHAKGLYDPETNIRFGMKYLALAHQLGGGTTCGTILKYNAGHGAKRMNPVSKRYCGKVQRIIN